MKVRFAIALSGCLLLAACGGGGDEGGNAGAGADPNASGAAESAEAGTSGVGADGRPRAGQWEIKTEFVGMEGAGMPSGMAEMMNSKARPMTVCITDEEASRPDSKVFTGQEGPNCKNEGFSNSGGKMSGTVTCDGPQGKMTMRMDGQMGRDAFSMTQRMTVEGPAAATTETRITGRRLGDCPAGAEV